MSAERRQAAVLGQPIGHSKSPLLHRAAYAELGLDWTYSAVELGKGDLNAFLNQAGSDYAGFSVTMPLKDEAFAACVDTDEFSRRTRACNTLLNGSGGWVGHNTDVTGFLEVFAGREFATALVLGSGATARSALVALAELGVRDLAVAARRPVAARELLLELGLEAMAVELVDPLPTAELVLSTLPAGAADGLSLPVGCRALFDVVYAPWPTPLATQALAKGVTVWSGLDLLVAQAVEQVLLMTGVDRGERERITAAMRRALSTAD